MRRFLILASVVTSTCLSSLASGSLSFNSGSFTDGLAIGAQDDASYYTISLVDPEFEINGIRFISAAIYIPRNLLKDGVFDLEVLKPSKKSNSAKSCSQSDNESDKFKLPSNQKVYIELGNTSIKSTDEALLVRGSVATGDLSSGTIHFENVVNGFLAFVLDGNFGIDTKVSSYLANIPNDTSLSCKDIQKKVKVKFNYNNKTSQASGNFNSVIITKSFE